MPTGERLMASRDARSRAMKEMIVFCLFSADYDKQQILERLSVLIQTYAHAQ
jgi:hypothetical protein